MQILITGVTGFVGAYLASELASRYPQARLFGTTFGKTTLASLPPSLTLLEADLRQSSQLSQVVAAAEPTHVFHLAGFASAAGTDAALIRAANVEATVALVEALHQQGQPCRLHLASTGYVYGTTQPGEPAQESTPLRPEGLYAQSKAEMERVVEPLSSDLVSITLTRAFNHTGPRQTPVFVVPGFARQLSRIERGVTEPVVRVGNLEAKRDFLDVRDVVRAYCSLLLEQEPKPWRVVNVASGEAVAIQSILDQLLALTRVPVTVEVDPERLRPADMPECVGDPTLLCGSTGWRKSIPLADTLRETLDWWRSQE